MLAGELKSWLEAGIAKKATHVIIVCDTFDYDDYPVYVSADEDVRKVYNSFNGPNMQKVMEVYNLSKPIDEQMSRHRCFEF